VSDLVLHDAMWLTMYDGPLRVVRVGDAVLGDPDRDLLPFASLYDAAMSRTSRKPPGSVGWLKSLHVGSSAEHLTGRPFSQGNPGMGATPKPCIGCDP